MKETSKLATNLSGLEADSAALERKAKHLDDDLVYVRDKLAIPATLHQRLSKLESNLKLSSELLLVVSIIPAISTAASTTRRAIEAFRKPIARGAKITGDIDRKIKPVRTKVGQAQKKTAKLDEKLRALVQREQELVQAVTRSQACIGALPSGNVKTQSANGLEALSAKADPVVIGAASAQRAALDTINRVEGRVEGVKRSLQSLIEIDASITDAMKTLEPLISQLQAIHNVFSHLIRVPYGGYPEMCTKKVLGVPMPYPCGWHTVYFSFSIQQILDGVTGVLRPVMDLLQSAMDTILNLLLGALNLDIKLPDIPGLAKLERLVDSLLSGLTPLADAVANLQREARALTAALDRVAAYAIRGPFDAAFPVGDRLCALKGKSYYLCRPGEGGRSEGPFPIRGSFGATRRGAPVDGPFDAAVAAAHRIYLFKGKRYLVTAHGAEEASGPHAIKGRWGTTRQGEPLEGPFDAVTLRDGQVYARKANKVIGQRIASVGATA